MARGWRSGSKARAAKLGRAIELPSIDQVHEHLKTTPLECAYCGIQLGKSKKTKPVMDHRLPLSRGGDAQLSNMALVCNPCNGAKGPLLEPEFRALLALIRTWEDGGASLLIRLRGGFYAWSGKCSSGGTMAQKISAKMKGVPKSEETRQKMSEAQKRYEIENPGVKEAFHRARMLGTHPTETARAAMSAAAYRRHGKSPVPVDGFETDRAQNGLESQGRAF